MYLYRVLLFSIMALLISPVKAVDAWSVEDKQREITYLTLHVIDWGQTIDIHKNPTLYHESNPVLGLHPSRSRIHSHFIVTGLLHVGLIHVLPSKYRSIVQMITITTNTGSVLYNQNIGLQISF